jgi:hypothetical protein
MAESCRKQRGGWIPVALTGAGLFAANSETFVTVLALGDNTGMRDLAAVSEGLLIPAGPIHGTSATRMQTQRTLLLDQDTIAMIDALMIEELGVQRKVASPLLDLLTL